VTRPATVSELNAGAEKAAREAPDVDTPPVHVAWARVMADVQAVGKTGHNKAQDYNFRGVDAVVNAVGPALRTHGVVVMPSLRSIEHRDVEVGKNRTLMTSVRVEVVYVIFGPCGDYLDHPDVDFGKVAAEAMDSGDKATSKAMSVAYRTWLIQALALPTHQPDPDEQTYERSAAREPQAPPVPEFLHDLIAATDGLSDTERASLRTWLAENGLPDRPSKMDRAQAAAVCDYIANGLPKDGAGSGDDS
jgi:hypothetical protein